MKQQVTIPQMKKKLRGKTIEVKQTFNDGRRAYGSHVVENVRFEKRDSGEDISVDCTDGATITFLRYHITQMILAGGYYKWDMRHHDFPYFVEYIVEGGL